MREQSLFLRAMNGGGIRFHCSFLLALLLRARRHQITYSIMQEYSPPVGFFFKVQIIEAGDTPFPPVDTAFQEVSGLNTALSNETIQEGGGNRFVHRVPSTPNYENLVLKRGLMLRSSSLADWCIKVLGGGLNAHIEPKNIKISLMDSNAESGGALMSWKFFNAYPIGWEIGALNAQQSSIVVESISFAYSYFETINEPAAQP